MAEKSDYFLRRDMPHGLTVLVGERDESDTLPYTAVVRVNLPIGHFKILVRKDGKYVFEIHPDGADPVLIIGFMDLISAHIETINDEQVDITDTKQKLN